MSKQAVQVFRSLDAQRMSEVKRWSAETAEVKYNDYVLLVLIFDLFIDLFVPFAAVCPTSVQHLYIANQGVNSQP